MNTEFLTVGINYQKTPIDLRERFSFGLDVSHELLSKLKGQSLINEALFLNTCNRAEVYAVVGKEPTAFRAVENELCANAGIDPASAQNFWYTKCGPEAIRHLFRVASSLDAMVVGEAQVLGQVKDAYFKARGQGTTGPFIDRAMLHAIQVAKRVRTETEIGKGPVSVASVAVDLAIQHLKDLSAFTVLVIGAGEMGALVVRQLKKCGAGHIIVANRTFKKALMIAEHTGGEAIAWQDLSKGLARADIVVSSTGSKTHVIDKTMLHAVMTPHPRPIMLIDLGSPRDIDPAAGEIFGVSLFNIDDLEGIAKENSSKRAKEAEKAEGLVTEASKKFFLELSKPLHLTAISMLVQKFEAIKDQEIEKTAAKLHDLSKEQHEIIEAGARSIITKILHEPISKLKDDDCDEFERALLSDLAFTLFGISGK